MVLKMTIIVLPILVNIINGIITIIIIYHYIVIDNDDIDDYVDNIDKDWAVDNSIDEDDDYDVDEGYVRCC